MKHLLNDGYAPKKPKLLGDFSWEESMTQRTYEEIDRNYPQDQIIQPNVPRNEKGEVEFLSNLIRLWQFYGYPGHKIKEYKRQYVPIKELGDSPPGWKYLF